MKTSTARLIPMFTLLLASGFTASARGETKLTTEVFTASPQGFLVTSTVVAGEKEAVLVDGQFTLSDAHRLVGLILDSKKTLTTVYVTHAHPDHYFGLVVIKQAFPKVKVIAQPATVAEIKKAWAEKVKHWGPMYGANLPTKPIIPEPFAGTSLTVEGRTIEIHGSVQGDDATNSYLWIPSIKTLVAGDIVYQGIFPWTAETNIASRASWSNTLDELASLGATTVIAGHKEPTQKDDATGVATTKAYLKDFDEAAAASSSASQLQSKMKAKYPKLAMDIVLADRGGDSVSDRRRRRREEEIAVDRSEAGRGPAPASERPMGQFWPVRLTWKTARRMRTTLACGPMSRVTGDHLHGPRPSIPAAQRLGIRELELARDRTRRSELRRTLPDNGHLQTDGPIIITNVGHDCRATLASGERSGEHSRLAARARALQRTATGRATTGVIDAGIPAAALIKGRMMGGRTQSHQAGCTSPLSWRADRSL